MNTIKEQHDKTREKLSKEASYGNIMAVPRLKSVTLNSGIGKTIKDPATSEDMERIFTAISGQKPVFTKAKKAISNFSVRRGMIVGIKVTMRGKRMWEFLEKFISAVMPRFKDFRGIDEHNVDGNGNLNIGVPEHTVFLEVDPNKVERARSLQLTMSLNKSDRSGGIALWKGMGIPFKD